MRKRGGKKEGLSAFNLWGVEEGKRRSPPILGGKKRADDSSRSLNK